MESDIQASFNCLRLQTTRILQSLIDNGKYTIIEIRELFQLEGISEEEIEDVETVKQLWKFLLSKNVISTENLTVLKIIAEQGLHNKELVMAVEEHEHRIDGMIPQLARLAIKIGLPVVGIGAAVLCYFDNNEIKLLVLEKIVLPPLVKLSGVREGSVCFVVETSSLSALKQLWTSYKDGSLREHFKKVINKIDEVRKLSDGTEIDMTVEIDEEQYHKACWVLVLAQTEKAEVEQESTKSVHRPRGHSLSCERDLATREKPHRSCQDSMILNEAHNKLINETRRRKYAEKQVGESRKEIEMLKSVQDTGKFKVKDISRTLLRFEATRRKYAEMHVKELREEIGMLVIIQNPCKSKEKANTSLLRFDEASRRKMQTCS